MELAQLPPLTLLRHEKSTTKETVADSDHTPCVSFLTRGQSIGLTVATIVGFVSAVAVLTLFGVVIKNIIRANRNAPHGKVNVFRSPLEVYMCSLLASDFLQGIGKVLHIKWLHDGVVQCGTYCTVQGIIQQIGETGVAQGTLAIAVHTFVIIFFRRGSKATMISLFVVAAIWCYVILFSAIGAATLRNGDDRYITPVPYWCWIGTRHIWAQLAGEYVWMWISAVISLVLYVPLYLCLSGYIEVHEDQWWKFRLSTPVSTRSMPKRPDDDAISIRNDRHKPTKEAFLMLLYPVSYVILVLPDSICRWMEFRGRVIPSAGTFFSTSIFGLSGLVNVALLLYTRPGLLLLKVEPAPQSEPTQLWRSRTSMESEDVGLRQRTAAPMLHLGEDRS